MRQSLIDSIGRESALKLMGDAVLQAIKENDSSGGFHKAKTVQVVDGPYVSSRMPVRFLWLPFHQPHLHR